MAGYLNKTEVEGPRNGTTSHTFSFTAASAGSYLVAIVGGAVTSTTPTGWTLATSVINNCGLYVFTKTATAGESSFSTTHNASNYPVGAVVYEYPAGTTWVNAVTATANASGAANPTLALHGHTGLDAFGVVTPNGNVAGSPPTVTWVGGTEDAEPNEAYNGSGSFDGYAVGVTISSDHSTASFAPTPTYTNASGVGSERITFALQTPQTTPVVVTSGGEIGTSLGAANAQTLPAGAVTGDLVAVWVTNDNPGATNITASTGWTQVFHTAEAGSTAIKHAMFARVLDGGANDTLTITGAAQDYCVSSARIVYHGVTTVSTDIKAGTAATATTGNANPPSLNAGSSNTWLWLASAAVDFTTGNTITVDPTNYTLVDNRTSASSTSSCGQRVARRDVTTQTEDPGTFTNTSRAWVANTVAIPPSAVTVTGSIAATTDAATAALTGTYVAGPITGTIAATTADAASSITATYTPAPITGTIAATLADAVAAISGGSTVGGSTGSIAVTTEAAAASIAGTVTAPVVTGTIAATTAAATGSITGSNVLSIASENALTGNASSEWDGVTGFGATNAFGYAETFSIEAGTTQNFKIHCPAGGTLDIYRLGYYNNNGARLWGTVSIPATTQSDGTLRTVGEGSNGSRDCTAWTTACSWTVPTNAVPGIYLGTIKRTGGGRSHIYFIVKNGVATTRSDLVVRTADFTWQAYSGFGTIASPTSGRTLYGGGTNVMDQANRAWDVTYNRPLTTRAGVVNTFFAIEYPIIKFLERQGYDLSYVSCLDVHNDASLLLNHEAMIAMGHDEYWSAELRTAWDAAIDAGVNAFVMSGNTMLWVVRMESGHRMVCYKDSHSLDGRGSGRDPVTWTGTWRDTRTPSGNQPPHDPENRSIGLFFIANGIRNDELLVRFVDKNRPIWRDCASVQALSSGGTHQISTDILGFEWDYIRPGHASNPAGMIALSQSSVDLTSQAANVDGSWYDSTVNPALHNIVAYEDSSGALVVNLGVTNWGWALDTYHDLGAASSVSTTAQQATVNVLKDMGVSPVTLSAGLTSPTDLRSTWFGNVFGTIAVTTAPAVGDIDGTTVPPAFTGTIAATTAATASSIAGTTVPPAFTATIAATTAAAVADIDGTYTPAGVAGTIAATTADAASSIAGTVTAPVVTGTIAATTDAATSVITATFAGPPRTATIAVTTANATATLTGTSAAPGNNTGTIAVTTAAATSSIVGTYVAPARTGSIAATTAASTSAITGTVVNPVTGSIAVTTGNATSSIAATFVPLPIVGSIAATLAPAAATLTGNLGTVTPTYTGTPLTTSAADLARTTGNTTLERTTEAVGR